MREIPMNGGNDNFFNGICPLKFACKHPQRLKEGFRPSLSKVL